MTPEILVTGTGSVGREVLLALLRRTPGRVGLLMPDRTRRPALPRAAALFERLALDGVERARIEVLNGDLVLPNLGLDADVQRRLTETLETIVHTAAASSTDDRGTRDAERTCTANALLLAERCFMAGRLQRFIHVNGETEDRMVRAAMNAGLPVTIIDPGEGRVDAVVNAVMRAGAARCA